MTKQQKLILAQLKHLLKTAKNERRREEIRKQITDFRKYCEPKPQPTRPAWVDEF